MRIHDAECGSSAESTRVHVSDPLVLPYQGRKQLKAELASKAESAMQQLQMFGHGCDACAADEDLCTSLQRHLVRTTGQELLDLLLSYHEVRPSLQFMSPSSASCCPPIST